MPAAQRIPVDLARRPELQRLAFLVWQRRIAVGEVNRRSLSMSIRHALRRAEAEGWGDVARQVVAELPTDRICGACGSRIGKVRSRLLTRQGANSGRPCAA